MFSVLRMDFKLVNSKPDADVCVMTRWSTEKKARMSRDIFDSTTSKYNSWNAEGLGLTQLWPIFEVADV